MLMVLPLYDSEILAHCTVHSYIYRDYVQPLTRNHFQCLVADETQSGDLTFTRKLIITNIVTEIMEMFMKEQCQGSHQAVLGVVKKYKTQ